MNLSPTPKRQARESVVPMINVVFLLNDLEENEPLMIRADKGVDATQIAGLLPKLAAQGVRQVKLISVVR